MSRRTAIIIIILVLVLGTGALYFLLGGKTPAGLPVFTGGSPFGTPPDDEPFTPGGTSGETPGGVDSGGRPLPSLRRLSDVPIAGAVGLTKNGSTYVRYVERATGHVYDVNPLTLEKVRLVNTTSPKIYEALFRPDAQGFISRSVAEDGDTVANTSVALIEPQSTSTTAFYTLETSLLRGGMEDIAVLPNGGLVYALDTGSVITANFNGGSARTLFTMAFSEWRLIPINNTSVLAVTKASESAQGYAYRLDTTNGRLTRVLGPLVGLTALPSPSGTRIAYGHSASDGEFSVLNTSNGVSLDILPRTLPEKCVWSRQQTSILICGVPEEGLGVGHPDSWYEGRVSYADRLWRFNTDTDTAEILLDPEESFDTSIDTMSLALTPDEDYLIFMNKSDLTLWSLKLD